MKYLKTIGFNSNQPIGRGFNYPYDTAFSADGRIFVMNRMGGLNPRGIRIQICTFDEDWLGEFSTGPGDGDDQFRVPVCMAFDAHDNLYVTDEALNEVKVFDSQGNFLRKWGTDIDGHGSLAGPAGVAHGADGSVFVVEQYANRVHKLTPGRRVDRYVGRVRRRSRPVQPALGRNRGRRRRRVHRRLAQRPDSEVHAGRRVHRRVRRDRATGMASSTGRAQSRSLARGLICVADWGNERVQILDANGEFQQMLTGEATLSKWAAEWLDVNQDELGARNRSDLAVKDLPKTPAKRRSTQRHRQNRSSGAQSP